MSATVLRELAAELAAEESVVSPHVAGPDRELPPGALAALVAAGPRTRDDGGLHAGVLEAVREGYLLHYGEPRMVVGADPDLALLAGDYLYALGLERLAAAGELASIRELSDLISLSAQLHAERGASAGEQAAALWLASTVALATGGGAEHEAGKERLRAGGDAGSLYGSAIRSAASAGLDERMADAAEAVGFTPPHLG